MKFEAVRIFLSSSKNFATMATWRVTTSLYCVNILRNIMPQYTTKQDFLRHTDIFTPHFIDDRVSSGYLLFNARVWIHGNQGPWFGENYFIAKARKWSTTRITSIIAENKTTCSSLASVASVSVRFRSKERGTRVKDRAKKWLSFHFSRGQNRKSCSSGFFGSETKRKRVSSLCMTP